MISETSTDWLMENGKNFAFTAVKNATFLGVLKFCKYQDFMNLYSGLMVGSVMFRAGRAAYPVFAYAKERPQVFMAVGCCTIGVVGYYAIKARRFIKENYTKLAMTTLGIQLAYDVYSQKIQKSNLSFTAMSYAFRVGEILI